MQRREFVILNPRDHLYLCIIDVIMITLRLTTFVNVVIK